MKIILSKKGESISDFEIENYVNDKIKNKQDILTSTGLVIDYIRVLVKEGSLTCSSVEIYFEKDKLKIDENGRLDRWPKGFCDKFEELTSRLL